MSRELTEAREGALKFENKLQCSDNLDSSILILQNKQLLNCMKLYGNVKLCNASKQCVVRHQSKDTESSMKLEISVRLIGSINVQSSIM